MLETIHESEKDQSQITTRLLVSVDRWRGIEEAKENYQLMKDYIHQEIGKQYIVGIEFSGNPKVSHFTEYKALFK